MLSRSLSFSVSLFLFFFLFSFSWSVLLGLSLGSFVGGGSVTEKEVLRKKSEGRGLKRERFTHTQEVIHYSYDQPSIHPSPPLRSKCHASLRRLEKRTSRYDDDDDNVVESPKTFSAR